MGDDASLIDDGRFQAAYREHWTLVFRLALALTNDWPAAEDIAQEAFTRLWQHRERVSWTTSVAPWLLVTCRRLATDRFRRLRRVVVAGPRDTPALDDDARLRWLDVQKAFARLTPIERAALALVALGSMTYDEAAAALETTPGALRAAASRGRSKLAEA